MANLGWTREQAAQVRASLRILDADWNARRQGNRAVTGLPQTVLAFITSNRNRTGSTRVAVTRNSPAGIQMGLLAAIIAAPGDCPVMERVDKALRATLDL